MRLLTIFGNTIRKRLLGAVLSLCPTIVWEDPFLWIDNCRWKEPQCCSSLWENEKTWNQNCPVRVNNSCCSNNDWDNLKNWGDDCDWIDGYTPVDPELGDHIIWEDEEVWSESLIWTSAELWEDTEIWNENQDWYTDSVVGGNHIIWDLSLIHI